MGQNEDCSPGDGTSDSPEKLLQRGGGTVRIYVILCDFGEGKIHAIKHIFSQEISTSVVKPLLVTREGF